MMIEWIGAKEKGLELRNEANRNEAMDWRASVELRTCSSLSNRLL